MGRLFWKVLLFTLLAQFLTALAIGLAIHAENESNARARSSINQSPTAAFLVSSAAATLRHGGIEALRELLAASPPAVYAVDDQNSDILGRILSPEIIGQARAMYAAGNTHQVLQLARAPGGANYLLFISGHTRPEPGFGPGPAPPDRMGGPEPGGRPPGPGPLVPILSALLGGLLFSTMIAWYFSRPIKTLRSAFESVANGNLQLNVVAAMGRRRDELADLGRDFDRMVVRLRALLDSQHRLMHDISHELRSPLARLQVATGLVRQQPERMDVWVERIENETLRMDRLVGELLTLSRLDTAAPGPGLEMIAMAELVADIVGDAQFEAQARGSRFEFTGDCAVCVQGDPELLRRAIENVVRNAIKYTPSGTVVELEAVVLDTALQLTILDRGPGVPDAELTSIFERFYRSSGNQNNSDGHGLGLSMAQSILNAFGGRICAQNREQGGGLSVQITLPCSRL